MHWDACYKGYKTLETMAKYLATITLQINFYLDDEGKHVCKKKDLEIFTAPLKCREVPQAPCQYVSA